jgi:hypothetical protein
MPGRQEVAACLSGRRWLHAWALCGPQPPPCAPSPVPERPPPPPPPPPPPTARLQPSPSSWASARPAPSRCAARTRPVTPTWLPWRRPSPAQATATATVRPRGAPGAGGEAAEGVWGQGAMVSCVPAGPSRGWWGGSRGGVGGQSRAWWTFSCPAALGMCGHSASYGLRSSRMQKPAPGFFWGGGGGPPPPPPPHPAVLPRRPPMPAAAPPPCRCVQPEHRCLPVRRGLQRRELPELQLGQGSSWVAAGWVAAQQGAGYCCRGIGVTSSKHQTFLGCGAASRVACMRADPPPLSPPEMRLARRLWGLGCGRLPLAAARPASTVAVSSGHATIPPRACVTLETPNRVCIMISCVGHPISTVTPPPPPLPPPLRGPLSPAPVGCVCRWYSLLSAWLAPATHPLPCVQLGSRSPLL